MMVRLPAGPGDARPRLCHSRKDVAGVANRGVSAARRPPKTFHLARVALARGDFGSAQRDFAAATPTMEKQVSDDRGNSERHARLGLLYAYMGKKEDAIRESWRAVELEPESVNAFHGAQCAANLALVYALSARRTRRLRSSNGSSLLPAPSPTRIGLLT